MEDHHLIIRAHRGLSSEVRRGMRAPMAGSIAGWVVAQKKPVLLNGTVYDEELRKAMHRKDIASSLSVPLIAQDRVSGVLNANRLPGAPNFVEEDKDFAVVLASQVASAIENARLFAESHERAQELARLNEELRKTYDQLIQSQKMSSLGLMAGTVAHDINNPLSVIMGHAQLLLMGMKKGGSSDLSVGTDLAIKYLGFMGEGGYSSPKKEYIRLILLNISSLLLIRPILS